MNIKSGKKDIATTIIALGGMLSIPVFIVKDRIRKIRIEEKEKKYVKKILKYTVRLENNLTNKGVIEYMRFLKNAEIPSKTLYKNIIIDVYKLVKNNQNINDRLKSELRILLNCKGINFIY